MLFDTAIACYTLLPIYSISSIFGNRTNVVSCPPPPPKTVSQILGLTA